MATDIKNDANGLQERINRLSSGESADFDECIVQAKSLSEPDRSELLGNINNIAFKRGIELPDMPPPGSNLPTSVAPEKEQVEDNIESPADELDSDDEDVVSQVERMFDEPTLDWILRYKRRYLFTLDNTPSQNRRLLIIHGDIPYPELISRGKPEIELLSVRDFSVAIADRGSLLWARNTLCLMLLSELSSEVRNLVEQQRLILGQFSSFKYIEIYRSEGALKKYEYEGEKLFDDVNSDLSISLTNADLNRAEETLIKQYFNPAPSLLSYKLLKGGQSGAKVVEVAQDFSATSANKFVIKIGDRSDGKIRAEERAVRTWVSNFDRGYMTEKKETATHEALRYVFASSDGQGDSKSFAEMYADVSASRMRDVIEDLFALKLFQEWSKTSSVVKTGSSVRSVYSDYVREKSEEWTKKLSFEDGEKSLSLFKTILDFECKDYITKVAHGDLHSRNIIVDGAAVFLIDFGFTEKRPAVIDYVTLEVSTRLGLIPFYLPTAVVDKADEDFLSDFDIQDAAIEQKINEESLKKAYQVISKIRARAKKDLLANEIGFESSSKFEEQYLLGLFCLTYRNLPFPDLNQKYAICLAKRIAEILVRQLGLAQE